MISIYKSDTNRLTTAAAPFYAAECGISVINKSDYFFVRPQGRTDYHLIYFTQGKGEILTANGYVPLKAGGFILLPPRQRHGYRIYHKDNAVYYWIHFDGLCADKIINDFHLPYNTALHAGISSEIIQLFENIISEMQIQQNAHAEICSAYLLHMIALFSRKYNTPHTEHSIETAARLIRTNLQNNITSAELAEACGYSEYHFIRLFKQVFGTTPSAYRNRLRIENACALIANSPYSFAEISETLGFCDPSHFTKIFKKFKGCSPQSYRKSLP